MCETLGGVRGDIGTTVWVPWTKRGDKQGPVRYILYLYVQIKLCVRLYCIDIYYCIPYVHHCVLCYLALIDTMLHVEHRDHSPHCTQSVTLL